MDQANHVVDNASCPRGSGGGRRSLERRRRRSLVLVTAAVLAQSASTTTVAFAPSPTTTTAAPQRRRPLHALSMVSFLEVPTAARASRASRAKGRGGQRGAADKSGRTVEIDVDPGRYGMLGLDDFTRMKRNQYDYGAAELECSSDGISNSLRAVPAIDSEILYEGITSAPLPPLSDGVNATAAVAAGAAVPKSVQKEPTLSIPSASTDDRAAVISIDEQIKPDGGNHTTTTSQQKPSNSTTAKKTISKSSTMPGFIKDARLEAHILRRGARRLPSPADRQPRLRTALGAETARVRRRAGNAAALYAKSPAVPDSLIAYAGEIHMVDRVTPREEKELGTRTQEAMRLRGLRDDLRERYGRAPTDDEWCAAAGRVNAVALREAVDDGMRAKNRLVASNLRMVQRVVNLYIRNGLGSEYNAGDLMQDGTMALIRAAEKFEPERGFRFSTYAMYWIRSAVKRSQTSQSRIINTPQRVHETHKRVSKQTSGLRKELGREPSKEELARACDISVLQLDRCRKAMSQVTFSLDAEVKNSHKPNTPQSRKDTMYDVVKTQVDETEFEQAQRRLMKEHLIGTLRRHLLPHEVDLLLLRYGLMDERALPKGMSGPLTIADVSKLVGLKPDKVRRIIINSQKQLRHLMREWEDFEYEIA